MLRRKLLFILGALVGLLLIVAVGAIWTLQGVLTDMDHTGGHDALVEEQITQMSTTISEVEILLREIQLKRERHLDALIERVELLRDQSRQFGEQYARPLPQSQPVYERITRVLPRFERHVGMLATTQDSGLAAVHMQEAMTESVNLRRDILAIRQMMREHMLTEQAEATAWFRWVVLGMAIVFLLVINIMVMTLLHAANMVLRPVDQLVEASRRLAKEEFSYRVAVEQDDEFGELARAYNHLAAELQANEQRKLETLAQAAVTLNHELNNASAIIKLQLGLLTRQSGGNAALEKCLRQINESLARMTATVEALKRVRRIVLTDYNADVKMLDLAKSVEEVPTEQAENAA